MCPFPIGNVLQLSLQLFRHRVDVVRPGLRLAVLQFVASVLERVAGQLDVAIERGVVHLAAGAGRKARPNPQHCVRLALRTLQRERAGDDPRDVFAAADELRGVELRGQVLLLALAYSELDAARELVPGQQAVFRRQLPPQLGPLRGAVDDGVGGPRRGRGPQLGREHDRTEHGDPGVVGEAAEALFFVRLLGRRELADGAPACAGGAAEAAGRGGARSGG